MCLLGWDGHGRSVCLNVQQYQGGSKAVRLSEWASEPARAYHPCQQVLSLYRPRWSPLQTIKQQKCFRGSPFGLHLKNKLGLGKGAESRRIGKKTTGRQREESMWGYQQWQGNTWDVESVGLLITLMWRLMEGRGLRMLLGVDLDFPNIHVLRS